MADAPLRILFDSAGTYDKEIKACELAVLSPRYGDTEESIHENYSPYDPQTHMLGIHHAQHGVVAFARIIVPGPLALFTFPVIAEEPWGVDVDAVIRKLDLDPQRTWDVATLGARGARGDRAAVSRWSGLAVYHAVLQAMIANDIPRFVGLLDSTVRRVLLANGIVFQTIPGTEPRYFLGSPDCTPVYLDVAETAAELRQRRPSVYRAVIEGDIPGLVPADPSTLRLPATAGLESVPGVIDLSIAEEVHESGSAPRPQ